MAIEPASKNGELYNFVGIHYKVCIFMDLMSPADVDRWSAY